MKDKNKPEDEPAVQEKTPPDGNEAGQKAPAEGGRKKDEKKAIAFRDIDQAADMIASQVHMLSHSARESGIIGAVVIGFTSPDGSKQHVFEFSEPPPKEGEDQEAKAARVSRQTTSRFHLTLKMRAWITTTVNELVEKLKA